MKRTNLPHADYQALLKSITDIIIERGLRATTMDLVASRLSMSKRTLYEIFESKNRMIDEAIDYLNTKHIEAVKHAFESSPTVLEAWLRIIYMMRDMIRRFNVDFFRDMDTYYKEVRGCQRAHEEARNEEFLKVCLRGVEQGVFRHDLNYSIQIRIFEIQVESLKRMEEIFPPDISLTEVYDSICIGFLRSIVTPKGMELVDSMSASLGKV
ncbi:MAG: TetR/AcrR family transcriptional regulator [Bacteroidales bacterium]|nr:TetR/AcrR family transcriptional regulator [Bacteroidales bacterium]